MNDPYLDGTAGITMLGFSIALGAYLRGVYASTIGSYDKMITEEQKVLWPLSGEYTQKQIQNLKNVGNKLVIVTGIAFTFMFLVLARVIASTINAHPSLICIHIPKSWLYNIDLFLISFLTIILVVGFFFHRTTSGKARDQHDAACMALRIKQSQISN